MTINNKKKTPYSDVVIGILLSEFLMHFIAALLYMVGPHQQQVGGLPTLAPLPTKQLSLKSVRRSRRLI
jgi:hypothetical protein